MAGRLMFGPMNEAIAKCGHWVIWDTRAPHTQGWVASLVASRPCQMCEIKELKAAIVLLQRWQK